MGITEHYDDLKHYYVQHVEHAQEQLEDLESLIHSNQKITKLAPIQIKSRVKSWKRVLDKLDSDKLFSSDKLFLSIPDILGARIVLNESNDIKKVIKRLKKDFVGYKLDTINSYVWDFKKSCFFEVERMNINLAQEPFALKSVNVILKKDNLHFEVQVRTATENSLLIKYFSYLCESKPLPKEFNTHVEKVLSLEKAAKSDKHKKELSTKPRDLRGQNFSNRVLIGFDFSNCDCTECDFSGSDLSFANFSNTNLYKSDFSGSVLYVTKFSNCDITRASFKGAYLYGAKFLKNVNVAYSDFSNLQLEPKRRSNVLGAKNEEHEKSFKRIDSLCDIKSYRKFKHASYYFEFKEYIKHEKAMQLSQIYNNLKTIHRENHLNQEASKYYYQEKKYLSRSFHIQATSEDYRFTTTIIRYVKTIWGFGAQYLCGYGEKWIRLALWITAFPFLYTLIYFWFTPINSIPDAFIVSIDVMFGIKPKDFIDMDYVETAAKVQDIIKMILSALFIAIIVKKLMRD